MGLQAQLPQVADEGAADAHGQHEREEQGDQAEDADDGRLDDHAHRVRPDTVLETVACLVVELGEFVEDTARGGVPALCADVAVSAGFGTGDGLLGGAQRGGAGVLPETLVPLAFRRRQHSQVDVVQQGPLGDEVGNVTDLVASELAHHQGGAEQGVLAGEQFAGPGDVDQSPCLLVQLDAVDAVEGGEQGVGGVDEAVVLVEGLEAGDRALLDAAAQ